MLKLAEQLAKLLKAKILSHREDGNTIIFVLSTGPKFTMTEAELKAAIAKATPPADEVEPADEPKVSKPKANKQQRPDSSGKE